MKEKFLFTALIISVQLSAQNVGIGITNPVDAKLEVQSAANTVAIFGGDGQGISVQHSNPAIGFNIYYDGVTSRYIGNGYAAVHWLDVPTGNMYIDMMGTGSANGTYSSLTRAMTINNQGAVGLGTAPRLDARVTVARGTGPYGTAMFRGSTYASHINYSDAENTYIRGGKAGSYVYLNNIANGIVQFGNNNGFEPSFVKVGINSPNPTYALEVRQANNRGLIMINAENFGNWHIRTGPALAPGSYQLLYYNENTNPIGAFHPQTGAYAKVSDERMKTDIMPLEEVGLKLRQLKPVQYKVDIPHTDHALHAGFIAQEIMELFPGLVSRQEKADAGVKIPDMHLLNYDDLSVYAIKIIQEQQQKIEALKQRLGRLKAKKEIIHP